jgi:hypothetical protein
MQESTATALLTAVGLAAPLLASADVGVVSATDRAAARAHEFAGRSSS